jgi:hypothetical protein
MDCLANAPEISVDSIGWELDASSSEALATSEPEPDLPLWFGSLLSRKAEARARRLRVCPRSTLPWRSVVARWPIDRRQRWGDRANKLQDAGLDWREAERAAFDELKLAQRPGSDDFRSQS